jgi:hypothetical protein
LQQLVSDERYRPLCEALFICGYSDMRRADYQPLLAWRDEAAARASCGCRRQFPGRGASALPGYPIADGCEPVARLSAAQAGKKTAAKHPAAHLPGGGASACPGYRSQTVVNP